MRDRVIAAYIVLYWIVFVVTLFLSHSLFVVTLFLSHSLFVVTLFLSHSLWAASFSSSCLALSCRALPSRHSTLSFSSNHSNLPEWNHDMKHFFISNLFLIISYYFISYYFRLLIYFTSQCGIITWDYKDDCFPRSWSCTRSLENWRRWSHSQGVCVRVSVCVCVCVCVCVGWNQPPSSILSSLSYLKLLFHLTSILHHDFYSTILHSTPVLSLSVHPFLYT